MLVRADSAYYAGAVISAARRAGARFSVTVTMNPSNRAAIATIAEDAWVPVRYPDAVEDPDTGELISDAVAKVDARVLDRASRRARPGPIRLDGPGQRTGGGRRRWQDREVRVGGGA
ncbi:hypothetical protein [Saccharopolyspora sp. ASAGF58]|uniref:hypothetical protein n=1 Tax=Saccharopolyspora sp. ASAGF58 TaxID=2719023 RepID=UPI00143FE296|nr:hypothetical protein [Saccharopolyspora sp. ASAGF58]QIZ37187.1 hypothetical protein FDZ84_24355 [Saccharopolyspora sp. ASAGF58]